MKGQGGSASAGPLSSLSTSLRHAVDSGAQTGGRKRFFWQCRIQVDHALMNAALSELAGQVLSGSARLSIRYDFVLFHLLRSRLTGVHGNRLWPEVAKALWGANVSSVDGDRAGSFFRRELKRHYAKRLRQMWQQRRYLCLAFEESGAGYNRAHFIREFLERLVSSLDNPYQPHGVD